MVMLIRKMFRDIWKNKVPFIAIFLMMFVGNFIFSGITCEYNGMNKSFHSFIERTNFADAWVISNQFEKSKIDELKNKSNITDVEERLLLQATLKDDENKSINLYILDNKNFISKIEVISGEKYSNDKNGMWLDISFAKENNYKLHDKIELDINSQRVEKEIIGLCYSPEYIYNTKNGELLPDHKNTGFAFINRQGAENLSVIPNNQLLVTGNGNVENIIKDTFGTEGITLISQKDHLSYSIICDEITQHKEIGLIFVVLFLFIAILITITTVHRLLNSQCMQIGILKALGFRKRCLYIHYISHSTFVCLLGASAGWCIGYVMLPNLIYPIMKKMYILPELTPVVLEQSWILPIFCTLISFFIAVIVCRKYLSNSASQILYSNSIAKAYKDLPLSSLRKHLSFYGQWNIRDIFRNRLRSAMTIFGVIGCVSLLFASLGLYTSMQNMSNWAYDKVQTFETKITGTFSNKEYKTKLLEDMFGEELMENSVELQFKDKEKTVLFTGIESQDYLRLYNIQNKQIILKGGIALSKNIAEEFHIQTGDRIKFKFSGSNKWYMCIVSQIIRTPMSQGITMMKSDMEKENIPFQAMSIIGEKPENVKINSNYVSSVQHKSDLKLGLDTMLNASVMLSGLFLIMAVLLGGVILYNLGTLSYMERYRDMATLKVLGFNNKRIRKLMIQQNLWLTVVGISVGIPTGYGLIIVLIGTIQSSIDMSVYLPTYVYMISILGTFFISWIINKTLSRKVKHIDMVSALKINE